MLRKGKKNTHKEEESGEQQAAGVQWYSGAVGAETNTNATGTEVTRKRYKTIIQRLGICQCGDKRPDP